MTEEINVNAVTQASGLPDATQDSIKPDVEGWRSTLPEELQGNETLKRYDSVEAAMRGFIETKSMQGNSIHLLGEDASDDQRATQAKEIMEKFPGYMEKPDFENAEQNTSFWQSLGKPENADGYGELEGLSENLAGFNPILHKANLTNEQYKSVMSSVIEAEKQQGQANIEAFNEANKGLRGDWGNKYEENYRQSEHMAQVMSDKTGFTGDVEAIKSGTAHPNTLKMYQAFFEIVGGEGATVIKDAPSQLHDTPNEAKEKIRLINNNPDHPYWTTPAGSADRPSLDKMFNQLMVDSKGRVETVM